MKAIALKKVNFTVNERLYECEQGQEVVFNPLDVEQAKASEMFTFIEKEEKPKVEKVKK